MARASASSRGSSSRRGSARTNISEEFGNLFLVGAGTHPGAGIPSVVTSSEVLTQLVPDAPRPLILPETKVAAE